MTRHRLTACQHVPRGVDEVFAFFAEPANLARITPASMRFEFLSADFAMRRGLEIEYRLNPLPGLSTGWRTLISDFEPPYSFSDVQLDGPYHSWQHRHTFRPVADGTLVEDEVEYELPFGPLGELGHAWLVRSELEQVFRHRALAVARIFETPDAEPEPTHDCRRRRHGLRWRRHRP